MTRLLALTLLLVSSGAGASAQRRQRAAASPDAEFGPNVRAYLIYLRDEQEVVDDRASRREIDHRYYLHNSNRIYALRQMAVRIARQSGNDYLPELEAFSEGEFEQFFEDPLPKASELEPGQLLEYKFRFLGAVATRSEKFYVFARLDPYEQAELRKKDGEKQGEAKQGEPKQGQTAPQSNGHAATAPPADAPPPARPRRVSAP